MLMGSFELCAAVQAATREEQEAWRAQEQGYLHALERAYQQEAEQEYNAGLQAYYAVRRQHQAEQQRLNQVLYGAGPSQPQWAALPVAHHQQAALQDTAMGDCAMHVQVPAPVPLPRLPLVAVNGGMQWEAEAGLVSRKRSADVAAAGWDGGAAALAESAFKRRSLRSGA